MTQTDSKRRITLKCATRIKEILAKIAQGYNTVKKLADVLPYSASTISRDLNSPEAMQIVDRLRRERLSITDSLVFRQIEQIERGGVKPSQQLNFRD